MASLQAVNLFWLFLILRIAKNYVFTNVAADERSEDEADDDEVEEPTKTMNGSDVKKQLEQDTGMATDRPVLLVNGEPIDMKAKPEGIKQRRKA